MVRLRARGCIGAGSVRDFMSRTAWQWCPWLTRTVNVCIRWPDSQCGRGNHCESLCVTALACSSNCRLSPVPPICSSVVSMLEAACVKACVSERRCMRNASDATRQHRCGNRAYEVLLCFVWPFVCDVLPFLLAYSLEVFA